MSQKTKKRRKEKPPNYAVNQISFKWCKLGSRKKYSIWHLHYTLTLEYKEYGLLGHHAQGASFINTDLNT